MQLYQIALYLVFAAAIYLSSKFITKGDKSESKFVRQNHKMIGIVFCIIFVTLIALTAIVFN